MKIYLAAPWQFKDEARAAAAKIEAYGHTITEKWWDQTPSEDHEELARQAQADIVGVAAADALIVLQLAKSEGKAAETGMAIAWMKAIVVVNPDPGSNYYGAGPNGGNIFQHLMTIVPTLEDALEKLRAFEVFLVTAEAALARDGGVAIPTPQPQGDGDGR